MERANGSGDAAQFAGRGLARSASQQREASGAFGNFSGESGFGELWIGRVERQGAVQFGGEFAERFVALNKDGGPLREFSFEAGIARKRRAVNEDGGVGHFELVYFEGAGKT